MIELNFPNAVWDAKDLFCRDREMELAEQAVAAASRSPVVILGERKIGKSSLHNVVAGKLEGMSSRRFAVLSVPSVYKWQNLASEILDGLAIQVSSSPFIRTMPMGEQERAGWSQTAYVAAYRQLAQRRPDTTFLLCLDEFDGMVVEAAAENRQGLLDFAQLLFERSGLPFVFFLTMTSPSERSAGIYPHRLLSHARKIVLRALDRGGTAAFVTGLLAPYGAVQENAQQRIYALSGGHPYFIKLILDTALRAFPVEADSLALSAADVDRGIAEAVASQEPDSSLKNVVAMHMSEREMDVLSWLVRSRGQAPLGRAPQTAAVAQLAQRDFIAVSADVVSFRIGLVYHWLQSQPWLLPPQTEPKVMAPRAARLMIDDQKRRVFLDGREVVLTRLQHRVLSTMGKRVGQVVPNDILEQEAWESEPGTVSNETIDNMFSRLRRILGQASEELTLLETRPGEGHILHNALYVSGQQGESGESTQGVDNGD